MQAERGNEVAEDMNLLVEMKGIRKSFYGVEVLHGVDFHLQAGTVHALMGENGAGKSTLMKVLAGVHKCDAGEIAIEGRPVEIDSPAKARELGIAMIHQELSPVSEMSVAENPAICWPRSTSAPPLLPYLPREALERWRAELLRRTPRRMMFPKERELLARIETLMGEP